MSNIIEIKGNIFNSKCQTIVNTVNCVRVMGKGLALEFRYRYPEMFNDYVKKCKANLIKTGELTIWKQSTPWIINFPTKNHWKNPSKIEYITDGLDFFANNYKRWDITSVAFPRLGTTNGKLEWPIVRKVMYESLKNLDLNIEIYEYENV